MSYAAADGRQQILDELAAATDDVGRALASVGAAYEQLDDDSAERLEQELFRPLQAAYGRAKRTHAAFAERSGLAASGFAQGSAGLASQGVKGFLDAAAGAAGAADSRLGELQDSMLPVDVGDPELRAGLAEVRELLAGVRSAARRFVSRFGR